MANRSTGAAALDDRVVTIDAFPLRSADKLRYGDTDRQGHVNLATFVSLLETGRIEILYDPKKSTADSGCTLVIARLVVEIRREIRWPGVVSIGTRAASIGHSSFNIEQALFQDNRCMASAETVIVHVNESTQQPQPLPAWTIARISALVGQPAA
jgi:acyl-CoA thioester hydrolase